MSNVLKIIAVCGATGLQGGSVLKALVNAGQYHVKAITRNPVSDTANQLKSLNNVSVHQANLDNPESLDSVLNGADGVFIVTDINARKENKHNQQAHNVIDAAARNKVNHVVLSGLDVDSYALAKPEIKYTAVKLCMYYSAITSDMLIRTGSFSFAFVAPLENKPVKAQDSRDVGEMVKTIFDSPDHYASKILHIAGDEITPNEIVNIMNKYLAPNTFINGNITLERYNTFGLPNQQFLTNMFRNFQAGVKGDIELTKSLNKNTLNFNDYVSKYKEDILQDLQPDKFKSSMQDKVTI
jgi:putative NADH-flavin reductase